MTILETTEISGLATPTYNSGAANKKYVDDNSGGDGTTYWSSQTNLDAGSIYYDAGKVVVAPSGTDYGAYRFQVSGDSYFSGSVTFRGTGISGIADPTYASGVANKHYVDTNFLHSGLTLNAVSANTLACGEYIYHIGHPHQYIMFEYNDEADGEWTTTIAASGESDFIKIRGGEENFSREFEVSINDGNSYIILGQYDLELLIDNGSGSINLENDSFSVFTDDGDWELTFGSDGYFNVITADSGAICADNKGYVGIGDIDVETLQYQLQVNGAISAQAYSGASLKLGQSTKVTGILDEDDMSSDSDTSLATQQSIKKYVDDNAGGGISGWYDLDTGTGITAFVGAVAISGTRSETISVDDYIASSVAIANFYPSALGKGVSGAVTLNTTHRLDNSQAHSDYLINNGDDTTTGKITSTGGGFTTTGGLSGSKISGGEFKGISPMTYNIANIRLSANQSLEITKFQCPATKSAYVYQAHACASGTQYGISGLYMQMLAGSSFDLTGADNVYKTSSQILQQGNPLGRSSAGEFVKVRLMYSGTQSTLTGIKYGNGMMMIGVY